MSDVFSSSGSMLKLISEIPFFPQMDQEDAELVSQRLILHYCPGGTRLITEVPAELVWEDVQYLFNNKPEVMSYIVSNMCKTISMRLRQVNSIYAHAYC